MDWLRTDVDVGWNGTVLTLTVTLAFLRKANEATIAAHMHAASKPRFFSEMTSYDVASTMHQSLLSGVFSLATICFTAALSFLGPVVYARFKPTVLGVGSAVLAGAGMLVAATAGASSGPLLSSTSQ